MKYRLFVNNSELDLFNDENIEIQETLIKSEVDLSYAPFSQTFTVPATDKNNLIFKHWGLGIVNNSFDNLAKNKSRLIGQKDYYGFLDIISVKYERGRITQYTVQFLSDIVDLKGRLQGLTINSLNLSSLSHEFTEAKVKEGLKTGLFGGDVVYCLMSDKRYTYDSVSSIDPLNIAFTGVSHLDLFPSVRIIKLIEAIENDFNISFTRDFLGLEYFSNLYFFAPADEKVKDKIQVLIPTASRDDFFDLGGNLLVTGYNVADNVLNFRTFKTSNSGTRVNYILEVIPELGFETTPYTVVFKNSGVEVARYDWRGIVVGQHIFETGAFQENFVTVEIETETAFNFNSVTRLRVDGWARPNPFSSRKWLNAYEDILGFGGIQELFADYSFSANLVKMPILDFLRGIFKIFRLVVIPEGNNKFYVDTLEGYISKGKTVDISKFVEEELIPIEAPKKYSAFKFQFSEPKTVINKQYKARNGRAFGDDIFFTNTNGEAYEVKVPFEVVLVEPLTDENTNNLTNIITGTLADENSKKASIAPFLHFAQNRNIVSNPIKFGTTNETIDTSIFMPSYVQNIFDIDEDREPSILFANELDPADAENPLSRTLFTEFYSEITNYINNPKTRIYTFNLVGSDILDIKTNTTIKYKNDYFRVLEITKKITLNKEVLRCVKF